jgi:hypothetical protein
MPLALTLGGTLSVVLAAVAVLAFVLSAWQLRLAILNQLRSAQPVVIVHESSREIDADGYMEFRVHLENRGAHSAFNVRFGVELGGTRYAYGGDAASRGARQSVGPGELLPGPQQVFRLRASWAPYALARVEGIDSKPVFWARYENPFGEVWETRNPADPYGDLKIKRLRRWQARRQERREHEQRRADEAEAEERLAADLAQMRREQEGTG